MRIWSKTATTPTKYWPTSPTASTASKILTSTTLTTPATITTTTYSIMVLDKSFLVLIIGLMMLVMRGAGGWHRKRMGRRSSSRVADSWLRTGKIAVNERSVSLVRENSRLRVLDLSNRPNMIDSCWISDKGCKWLSRGGVAYAIGTLFEYLGIKQDRNHFGGRGVHYLSKGEWLRLRVLSTECIFTVK